MSKLILNASNRTQIQRDAIIVVVNDIEVAFLTDFVDFAESIIDVSIILDRVRQILPENSEILILSSDDLEN